MTHEQCTWVETILANILLPFGTFEKAKYILYRHGHRTPVYFFTTTIHSREECIEIMKSKYKELAETKKYCSVYKVQNNVKELIYTDKPFDKP